MKKFLLVLLIIFLILALVAAVFALTSCASFGRLPRGERLERVKNSPNYKNGHFVNEEETVTMTSDKGFFSSMKDFLFTKYPDTVPTEPVPSIKTDLKSIPKDEECIVWFGHSSYLLQTGGVRFLVDPVFLQSSPVWFANKPFPGSSVFTPDDMPEIDYLVISHDHWDHLDYKTAKKMVDKCDKAIVPLGVGEDFEYWGWPKSKIIELDWNESANLKNGVKIDCLPTRHFSGRGLVSAKTLWASYMVLSPKNTVFLGGDGGYDGRFKRYGGQYDIDWAILENGQYSKDWSQIHCLPEQILAAAQELRAKHILTVHWGKFCLSTHPWTEPLENARKMKEAGLDVVTEQIIGQKFEL